jgi:hypothetical protein
MIIISKDKIYNLFKSKIRIFKKIKILQKILKSTIYMIIKLRKLSIETAKKNNRK